MRLSSSPATLTAATVAFFTRLAEAATAKSDIFGWDYKLDLNAPVVTNQEDMEAVSHAYRGAVSLELVNGTMMMIDMMDKKQVAILGGDLDHWARANYPGQDVLEDSALIQEMTTELAFHLDNIDAGIPMQESLIQRRELAAGSEGVGLEKGVCLCPVVIFSCPIFGCNGACIIAVCVGLTLDTSRTGS